MDLSVFANKLFIYRSCMIHIVTYMPIEDCGKPLPHVTSDSVCINHVSSFEINGEETYF